MLRRHFKIIALICLVSSLSRFVLDSYLPSLPAIRDQFNITNAYTQFTLTIYLLGFSLSQLFYGPLSDRFGRRAIILSGMVIFFVGNFACSIATTAAKLIISRLIAGLGAGACGALNRAIASDCFKGRDLSKAWSYSTTTLVLTLIVAPIFGGFLQETYGWRANFVFATLLVAAVFFIVSTSLPETQKEHSLPSINIKTVLKHYYHILSSRVFLLYTLCYTLAFSGLIIYFQLSPLLYINGLGLTPTEYGYSSIIIGVSYLAGGIIVNKLAKQVSLHVMLSCGALLLITGGTFMLVAAVLHDRTLAAILVPSAIYVIGARIVIPNAIAGAMEPVRHLSGSSSALMGCMQMLGSSLVSLLVARFDANTPYPLAFFLTLLGIATLAIAFQINSPLPEHCMKNTPYPT